MILRTVLAAVAVILGGCASAPPLPANEVMRQQVVDTERAFARTLADRDFAGFNSFLAEEAIFFGRTPLRGKQAVGNQWKAFFDGPQAPFSWEPQTVQVLDSGTLALSSGPVYDPDGTRIATFSSIWRREAPGVWKIVFDKGCDVCVACPKP